MAASGVTSSNAIASITGIREAFFHPSAVAGNQFGLTFNAISNASFSVWVSTNLANGRWHWDGPSVQASPGQYQFFDPASTNAAYRFYRTRFLTN